MRFLVVAVLVGCVGGAEPVPPEIEASGTVQLEIPLAGNRPLDILLVIDNSPAMAEHQERLQGNLRRLGDLLEVVNTSFFSLGGRPSLRIAVVTTDLGGGDCGAGDDGVFRGLLVQHVSDAGLALRNYDGALPDALAKLGNVGTTGCARTQPLAAAKRALENPTNADFIRSDSSLAIIFITASDAPDESIEGYEAFLKSLHVEYRTFVGGVLGVEEGQLPSFIDRFDRSLRIRLADADWSPVLRGASSSPWTTYGVPCLDAANIAERPVCDAWYHFPRAAHQVLPCDEAIAGPCWKLVEDRQYCVGKTDRRLQIERPIADIPSKASLTIECVSR